MQLPSHRASKCRARPKSAPPAKRMRSAIKNGSVARPRDVVAARKRLVARLRIAKLRHQASIEDVDYRSPRGLDRALFQKHDNLALAGPTGVGILGPRRPVA
jgi:hypothetical protein